MADSGNILATERPLPVQKAKTPPSEYIRTTALAIVLIPVTLPGVEVTGAPPRSGGRVMRKILRRSNGAVHVLETNQLLELQ